MREHAVPVRALAWAIERSLAHLSRKHGIPPPKWQFAPRRNPFVNADYHLPTKTIIFYAVNPDIVAHEFHHHVKNSRKELACRSCLEGEAKQFAKKEARTLYQFWKPVYLTLPANLLNAWNIAQVGMWITGLAASLKKKVT